MELEHGFVTERPDIAICTFFLEPNTPTPRSPFEVECYFYITESLLTVSRKANTVSSRVSLPPTNDTPQVLQPSRCTHTQTSRDFPCAMMHSEVWYTAPIGLIIKRSELICLPGTAVCVRRRPKRNSTRF